MLATTIFASAITFATLSSAQSTISLFVPGADTQPLVASVVGSDTLATTYAVQCVPGTDASNCGIPGVILLTEGPATAAYTVSEGYSNASTSSLAFTGYFGCSLAGTTYAVCTNSFSGDEANQPGMTTETLVATDITYMPVIITTKALIISGTGTSSPVVVPSTTKTAATKTVATASNTSGAKSSTSMGVAPVVRGKAHWVVGGAALALALIG